MHLNNRIQSGTWTLRLDHLTFPSEKWIQLEIILPAFNRCYSREAWEQLPGLLAVLVPVLIIDSTKANCSFQISKRKWKKKKNRIYNSSTFLLLHWKKEQDYKNCRDRFCGLKCSVFFHELQIQTISSAASRCFARMFAFSAPCVEEEKQEGKTEHKLSDAWTYEYLSVNASRWTSRPRITQMECPRRVPYLLGDLYDHEMISRQDGFGEIDPFVFGLTALRRCMIALITCVKTRFVSSQSDNISVWICFLQLYLLQESCMDVGVDLLHCTDVEIPLQGSMPAFLLNKARKQHAQPASDLGMSEQPTLTNPKWHAECLGLLGEWGVQSSHH